MAASEDGRPQPAIETCTVPPEELRWTCPASVLRFETTDDLDPCPVEVIGQPRAMEALDLGLAIRGEGYNVFVAGDVGSGRSTAVRQKVRAMTPDEPTPSDLVYVHNFVDPDRPRLLAFAPGGGRAFHEAMAEAMEGVRANLPRVFESDAYREGRAEAMTRAEQHYRESLKAFEAKVAEEGFAMVQIQVGDAIRNDILPKVGDEPVGFDDLEARVAEGALERSELERLREIHGRLTDEWSQASKLLREARRNLRREIAELDRRTSEPVVRESIEDVRETFEQDAVREYLDGVYEDLLQRLHVFRELAEREHQDGGPEAITEYEDELLRPYRVNVLVDNGRARGRPVLWESSPTYRNLFGIIDPGQDHGREPARDHTHIKAGSLVRANGGFLVIDALDLLVEGAVWPALKQTLRTGELEIRGFDARGSGPMSLQPEPIPLDIKVILLGTPQIYRSMYGLDEDFRQIFKVKADFAHDTEISDDEIENYACFVRKKTLDDRLPPFEAGAVGGIVEYAMRLAGRRGRLTTHFNDVADTIREAGYFARQDDGERVRDAHVDRALDRRRNRLDRAEEDMREQVLRGARLIDVEGARTGQVNGLAVVDYGDYRFGIASRITATTAMGRSGIVDIEREARLAGQIHTKAMLILAGFLRDRFAQDKPLTLSASVCFEQSYGPVEGDSASCAELFALLSSLSGLPLTQGIAVTGSVNQKGDVQPIGGVNEKIEGFHDLCRRRGLDGHQGVIVPQRNVGDLMLDKAVVADVREGRFSVWGISTVEEGVEILTGVPAGVRRGGRGYPVDTVFRRVDERLAELAERVLRFGAADRAPE